MRRFKSFLAAFLLSLALFSSAVRAEEKLMYPQQAQEPPDVEWENTFGDRLADQSNYVQQTRDGCYVAFGETNHPYITRGWEVYLFKVDAAGNKLWEKTFGGSGADRGKSGQQTNDGGYIIVGSTESYGAGESDVYLIKTDESGNMLWEKTFGGKLGDYGKSVRQADDGGYIILGTTESFSSGLTEVYLIKTDAGGMMQWEKALGSIIMYEGGSLIQARDGGYILTGAIEPSNKDFSDVCLIKTDGSGNKLWERTFGGDRYETGRSVQQTGDGGYIIVGCTYSFGAGNEDVYLIKTDSSGNKLWERTIGGSLSDDGWSVQQTIDGGYIIAGDTVSVLGYHKVYIVKTDSEGNLLWDMTLGNEFDKANSVQQTSDGGYIIGGYGSLYDAYLIKLKSESSVRTEPPAIKILLNNKPLSLDVQPIIRYGRVLVPLKAVSEALGAKEDRDGKSWVTTITRGETTVRLWLHDNFGYINNNFTGFDVPAEVVDGCTLVPLGFISQCFDLDVNWNKDTNVINIYTKS